MNIKMQKTLLFGLIGILLSSCEKEDDSRMIENARLEGREQARGELEIQLEMKDKLIQRAREEGRAVAEQEILAQNEMNTKKAKSMEADLTQRHRFYQSIAGVYEGDLLTEEGNFKVKITLVPTLSPYPVTRTRMQEEIAQDLNLLAFSAQIVEWNPLNSASGVGCRVENIHPDLTRGTITIAKETCASVYSLMLQNSKLPKIDSNGRSIPPLETSRRISASLLAGKVTTVPEIEGVKRPTTNATEYSLKLRRRN